MDMAGKSQSEENIELKLEEDLEKFEVTTRDDECRNRNHMNFIDMRTKDMRQCKLSLCIKQPILVKELTIEHLPISFRAIELLTYIKQLSQLAVKVTVGVTSPHRNDHEKYRLSVSNTQKVRQASGWCGQILEDVPEIIECPCLNCAHSKEPHNVIGPFYVMTARHVVFDQIEAASTTISFTVDSGEDSDSYLCFAEGYDVAYPPEEDRDFVYIKCYSHKLDIFAHLRSITDRMIEATHAMGDANLGNTSHGDRLFIISHPHDLPKHISFGTIEKREESDIEFDTETGKKLGGLIKYTYDVPACPGSSGAAVCVMGTDSMNYYQFPHSFDPELGKGVNSGIVDYLND